MMPSPAAWPVARTPPSASASSLAVHSLRRRYRWRTRRGPDLPVAYLLPRPSLCDCSAGIGSAKTQTGDDMADLTDGFTMVLGPEDGEGFWQPQPSRGYAINKITPYNSPHNSFALGSQILEPGAHIRRQAHQRPYEVLFCYAGKGRA